MSIKSRSWMHGKRNDITTAYGIRLAFRAGVDDFVHVTQSYPRYMDGEKIKCLCKKCKNFRFEGIRDCTVHLYKFIFTFDSYKWTAQGEPFTTRENVVDQMEKDDDPPPLVAFHYLVNYVLESVDTDPEDSNPDAAKFYDELKNADTPLYEGHKKHFALSCIA